MATLKRVRSLDLNACFRCQDPVLGPVLTSCVHRFCKSCLNQIWDQTTPFTCPQCKTGSDQTKTQAVRSPEPHICEVHLKPLEWFCLKDQVCLCESCLNQNHKDHEVVSALSEVDRRKSILNQVQAQTRDQLDLRRLKIQEVRQAAEKNQREAETETDLGVQAFRDLLDQVQTSMNRFIDQVQDQLRLTQNRAQDLVQDLDREIQQLQERKSEVDHLVQNKDQCQILMTPLSPGPVLKDWTNVALEPVSLRGSATKALSQVQASLGLDMQAHTKDQLQTGPDLSLERVQDYAVDLTLDPDSAFPKLVLSKDLKQVFHGEVWRKVREYPARFSYCPCVVSKESFGSGRFYFEVQVQGKTSWTVGVARDSMNRKGRISASPESGLWTLSLRDRVRVSANTGPAQTLVLKSSLNQVGIYTDLDRGLVSFYNVDSTDLIWTFRDCSFKDRLKAYINPCSNEDRTNSAPLVLTQVQPKTKPGVVTSPVSCDLSRVM